MAVREQSGRPRQTCLHCGYVHYHNPVPGVGVIVEMDGGVVLVKRRFEPRAGWWCLPAGFLEADESAAEGAVRECKEETGLDVAVDELFGVYSFPEGMQRSGLVIFYTARVVGGELHAGDDAEDVRVFPVDGLPENVAFRTHRQVLARLRQRTAAPDGLLTPNPPGDFPSPIPGVVIRHARPEHLSRVLALLRLIPANANLSDEEMRAVARRFGEGVGLEVLVAEAEGGVVALWRCPSRKRSPAPRRGLTTSLSSRAIAARASARHCWRPPCAARASGAAPTCWSTRPRATRRPGPFTGPTALRRAASRRCALCEGVCRMMKGYDQIARFYDLEHDELTEDLLMYENFARRCGSPVLELGCGSGRVALHLARAGFEVTGLDASPGMLALARGKLARARLEERVRLLEADLRDFTLEGRFAMATLAINTFMHFLTIADQVRALTNARRRLKPGGLLVIDLPRADRSLLLETGEHLTVSQVLTDPEAGLPILKLVAATVDLATQTQHLTLAYDETGEGGAVHRTTASFKVHYFFRYEMALLLDKAGFDVEAVYGSYALDPFEDDSERMIFVARAPG